MTTTENTTSLAPIVVVELSGGDSDRLDNDLTIWVDLDRGNAGEWAVLTTRDCIETIAHNCDAEVVSVIDWDGESFGDGSGGTVELRGGRSIICPGAFKPTYVPAGYVVCAERDVLEVATSVATPTTTGVVGGLDVDVTVTLDGIEYDGEVTLVPDSINGGWTSYGPSADYWVSGALLASLTAACGSDERLHEVLGAIRDAAASDCDAFSGPTWQPGDRVVTIDESDDARDAGVVHRVLPDGQVLVGWESGVTLPIGADEIRAR